MLVYDDSVPPVDGAPSLSGPHYANVVAENVLASVFERELLPQVEEILDDL